MREFIVISATMIHILTSCSRPEVVVWLKCHLHSLKAPLPFGRVFHYNQHICLYDKMQKSQRFFCTVICFSAVWTTLSDAIKFSDV